MFFCLFVRQYFKVFSRSTLIKPRPIHSFSHLLIDKSSTVYDGIIPTKNPGQICLYGKAFTSIGLVFVLDVKGSDRKSPNKKQNNTCWPLVRDFVLWFVTSGGNLNNLVSCHDLNIHSSNYWNHSCCVGEWRNVGSAKTVVFCYHAVVGVWNENDDMRSKWINRKVKLQPNDKLTIKCRFFDTVEYWKQTLMKRIGLK